MNETEAGSCELLQAKLEGLHEEVLALSKKSPNDSLNKFKLTLVNGILAAANEFLVAQRAGLPVVGFQQFDNEEMPSNSDVVLVVSQYRQCIEKLRADNIVFYFGQWYWLIDGQRSEDRTAAPRSMAHG